MLQVHDKETPHCWLRVSNVGNKLLVHGFQEVVRAVEFADRPGRPTNSAVESEFF